MRVKVVLRSFFSLFECKHISAKPLRVSYVGVNHKVMQGTECFPTLSAEVIHTCVVHTTAQFRRVPEVISSRGHMVTGCYQTSLYIQL